MEITTANEMCIHFGGVVEIVDKMFGHIQRMDNNSLMKKKCTRIILKWVEGIEVMIMDRQGE